MPCSPLRLIIPFSDLFRRWRGTGKRSKLGAMAEPAGTSHGGLDLQEERHESSSRQGSEGRRQQGRRAWCGGRIDRRQGNDLRRRFRQAREGRGGGHDAGHRGVDRLDDQGGHWSRRHAARRARQAFARWAGQGGAAGAGQGRGAGRLRRRRQAPDAQAQARHHAAPSADPHCGLRLRHLEPRGREVHGGARHSGHHLLPGQGADHAAALPASAGSTASTSTSPARWSRR